VKNEKKLITGDATIIFNTIKNNEYTRIRFFTHGKKSGHIVAVVAKVFFLCVVDLFWFILVLKKKGKKRRKYKILESRALPFVL
jgi:hypothetical protein